MKLTIPAIEIDDLFEDEELLGYIQAELRGLLKHRIRKTLTEAVDECMVPLVLVVRDKLRPRIDAIVQRVVDEEIEFTDDEALRAVLGEALD